MTLDEAIIWYKDLAELDYGLAESYHTDEGVYLEQETKCRERAENYEQLVEWLKELKAYRSLRFSIGEILVDESKWHISSEKAIEKIRNKMVDFDSEQRR